MFGNRRWICHVRIKINKLQCRHAAVLRIRAFHLTTQKHVIMCIFRAEHGCTHFWDIPSRPKRHPMHELLMSRCTLIEKNFSFSRRTRLSAARSIHNLHVHLYARCNTDSGFKLDSIIYEYSLRVTLQFIVWCAVLASGRAKWKCGCASRVSS